MEFIITLQQIAKSLSWVQFLKGCEREFGSRLMDDILLLGAVIKGCQGDIRFVVDGRYFIVTHSPKFSVRPTFLGVICDESNPSIWIYFI